MTNAIARTSRCLGKGIGQIMLQENPWTGAAFLLAIGLNNVTLLLGALIGVVASTATAVLTRYPKDEIESGLFGFNGALVGIAAFVFMPCQWLTGLIALLGAALSSVVMKGFMKVRVPPFTAPFVIVTWLLLAAFPQVPAAGSMAKALDLDLVSCTMNGLGQIVFQENIISGVVILLGILLNSRRDAFFAVLGSLGGAKLAALLGCDVSAIAMGLFGYSAALCGIALSRKPGFALAAIALSTLLAIAFRQWELTALTAPFVIGTWMMIALQWLVARFARPDASA